MAIVLALPKLFDDVIERWEDEEYEVPNVFGWRKPAQRQGYTQRVVWVPGDDSSGNLGEFGPARYPGRDPRPLATLHELATIYVEGFDQSAPEDERAQYQAARVLFDAWWRAVYLAGFGNVALLEAAWHSERVERRHGATIRVLLSVDAMLPDLPATTENLKGVAIDLAELDHSQELVLEV